MKQKRSAVWTYFTVKDKATSTCSLCLRDFKNHGSTGNLIDHLRRRHSTILSISTVGDDFTEETMNDDSSSVVTNEIDAPTENRLEMPSTSDFDPTPTSSLVICDVISLQKTKATKGLPKHQVKRLNTLLIDMIAGDFQPISIIQGEGFINFVRNLEPRYILPSRRDLLTRYLPQRYNDIKIKVKKFVSLAEHVSLTADIWTLKNTRCFISCTVYLILNSKLFTFLLSTEQIPKQYTSENAASALRKIANDWEITDKITAIVTHNNAVLQSAIEEIGIPFFPCVAHTLHLVVADALQNDSTLLEIRDSCRHIVNYFKSNDVASAKLSEIQSEMTVPHFKLKQEFEAQWTSTVNMFDKLIKIKKPLSVAMAELPDCPLMLTSDQWEIISDCVVLLRPLAEMVDELSAEQNQIASQIIPLIQGTQQIIVISKPSTDVGAMLRDSLIDGFNKRLAPYDEHIISAHATLLDPRLKEYGFGQENCAAAASSSLVKELTPFYNEMRDEDEEMQTDESAKGSSLWSFLDKKMSKNVVTSESKAEQDMKQYLSMALVNRKTGDPFEFWEKQKITLPFVAKLANKYLCVPASLVQAKKLFNRIRFVKSIRQANLKARKNINMMIFIHSFVNRRSIA